MGFLRPDAVVLLRRWLETGAAAASVLLVLWNAPRFLGGGWPGWVVLCVLGVPALLWLRTAYARARLAAEREGPGIVIIDERRIGYLGPSGGGFADLESLTAIDVARLRLGMAGSQKYWVLYHRDGPPVYIPARAAGADALPDAFSALEGFSLDRVLEAMSDRGGPAITIWQTAD